MSECVSANTRAKHAYVCLLLLLLGTVGAESRRGLSGVCLVCSCALLCCSFKAFSFSTCFSLISLIACIACAWSISPCPAFGSLGLSFASSALQSTMLCLTPGRCSRGSSVAISFWSFWYFACASCFHSGGWCHIWDHISFHIWHHKSHQI